MGSCLNQFLWNMINISQLVVPLCPMSAFVVGYGTSQLGGMYVCGLNGMQDKRAECLVCLWFEWYARQES